EQAIRLGIYKGVFRRPAAILFNTDGERRFIRQQFTDRPQLEEIVGVGVDIPQHQPYPRMPEPADDEAAGATREDEGGGSGTPADDAAPPRDFPSHLLARGAVFRRRHRLYGPILLYGGRIDPG